MDTHSHGQGEIYPERLHGIGEEEHHEKKPVLKKMKDKMKKIKNTITNKGHGQEHEHDYVSTEEEEEDGNGMEVDPEVHGSAPMYESNAAIILPRGHDENLGPASVGLGSKIGEDSAALDSRSTPSAHSDYTHHVSPPSAHSDYTHHVSPPSAHSDYTHHVSPPSAVYESSANRNDIFAHVPEEAHNSQATTGKMERGHDENTEVITLGNIIGHAEEDPAAPTTKSTTSAPTGYTKLPSPVAGSNVIEESPIIESFEAMVIDDASKGKEEATPPPTGTHDQFSPEKESQQLQEKGTTYTEKISSTATAAKEAAASAASTVYNKVSEASTAVVGKVQSQVGPTGPEQSGGTTSVKEFFAQKLRPGDEDRALSEVISDTISSTKEEEEEEEASSGGKGMVDKIKGVVTSFLGPGRVSGNQAPPPAQDPGVRASKGVVEGSGEQLVGRKEEEDDNIKHGG